MISIRLKDTLGVPYRTFSFTFSELLMNLQPSLSLGVIVALFFVQHFGPEMQPCGAYFCFSSSIQEVLLHFSIYFS